MPGQDRIQSPGFKTAMAKSILTPELLGQPARLAARTLARHHLLKVLEEAARLEVHADEDPEAVHDFRVALRRLRSWLQAFRPVLDDTVTKDSLRQLRRLSRVAGEARDLQVQRASLRELGKAGNSSVAEDALRIERRIAKDEARARSALSREVVGRLSRTAARLAAELRHGELDTGATMAVALAQLLMEHLEQVETSLSRLKRVVPIEPAHKARIAMKRLRYLLEVFGGTSRLAATAVLRLTEVQDEFGRLHDAQVLERGIAKHRARPVLRTRLHRITQASFRRAYRLSRSKDIITAQDATTRLIRRLELRSQAVR
jgi:CHAD domain-containing protein